MLLISTTHKPATDLGFLLHKNPNRIHRLENTFGETQIVFPEISEDRTTVALLLNIDPIALVRGRGDAQGALAQYVNDRPFVASSFLSVAIAGAFGTAINGRSKERQELAETEIALEVHIPVLPARGGEGAIRRLLEPLGYAIQIESIELDAEFPEWGTSPYYKLTLNCVKRLSEVLRHLYVLLPVLDAKKHYFLGIDEVNKLITKGEGWLQSHPEREWIVRSYLGRRTSLISAALEQLANADESLEHDILAIEAVSDAEESASENSVENLPKVSLHSQRHERIVEIVRQTKPESLLDLGCGDGKLIRKVIPIQGLKRIVGMDVSYFELEKANRKLKLEDSSPRYRERIQLIHGSLLYRDSRLSGFDCCTIVEVIEHLDSGRLAAFEKVVFEYAKPKTVLLSTPNREYNAVYALAELRHTDHRFEWTREEFENWAKQVGERHGYTVEIEGIGDSSPEFGSPSQLARFTR